MRLNRIARLLVAPLRSAFDALRGSYWFVPMMMALVAGIAAVGMVKVDESVDEAFIESLPWIDATGPEGARSVLSVIAGSMITVTGDESVMSLAQKHDLTVALHRSPGDFVAAGTALAHIGPSKRLTDDVLDAFREGFVLGDHRTPVQDLGFLIDQLTEIAVRAPSAGMNDPRTASDCVNDTNGERAEKEPRCKSFT